MIWSGADLTGADLTWGRFGLGPIWPATVKGYIEEIDLHGMEWPAQSPDLNIIENVWHKIKHELQKHVQNITSCQDL